VFKKNEYLYLLNKYIKMQHLEVSGAVVLYIRRTVSKGQDMRRITGTSYEEVPTF
jgi:hypothetical protein